MICLIRALCGHRPWGRERVGRPTASSGLTFSHAPLAKKRASSPSMKRSWSRPPLKRFGAERGRAQRPSTGYARRCGSCQRPCVQRRCPPMPVICVALGDACRQTRNCKSRDVVGRAHVCAANAYVDVRPRSGPTSTALRRMPVARRGSSSRPGEAARLTTAVESAAKLYFGYGNTASDEVKT